MTLIEQLRKSPRLAMLTDDLNRLLAIEQIARRKFCDEMNEDSHAEFINGEVVAHSPARFEHHIVRDRLLMILQMFNLSSRLGLVGAETYLISLTRNDYEPDVLFWRESESSSFESSQMKFPAPDFIVEVVSPSTEAVDRGIKFEDYAAHNVLEYWIVDPAAEFVEQYMLVGGQYQLVAKSQNGTLSSLAMTGLELSVRAIFDDDANREFIAAIGEK